MKINQNILNSFTPVDMIPFQLFMQRYEHSASGNKDLQALLDFLQGIMILTEEDLIRFLDVFHKEENMIPDIENSKGNSVDRKGHKENSGDTKEVEENSVDRNETKENSKGNSVDRKVHEENSKGNTDDRNETKQNSIDRKKAKENSKESSINRKKAKENSKENSVDRQRHKQNSKENSEENLVDGKGNKEISKEISVDSLKTLTGKTLVIDFDPHTTIGKATEQKPKGGPISKQAKKHKVDLKHVKHKQAVQEFEETDQCSFTGHTNKDHYHEDLDDNKNQRIDKGFGMCHLVCNNEMENKQIHSEGLSKIDFGRPRSKIIDGDKEMCCIDSNGNMHSVGKCMFKGADNVDLDINRNNKYGNSKMVNACIDKAEHAYIYLNKNSKEHANVNNT